MSAATPTRRALWIYWLVYAVVAVLLFRYVPQTSGIMDLMFNDDLARLVEVRDWMAGQGWADLMQYRMGPEGGTLMHWSRLVDAPIAAMIWLAGNFLPVAQAEAVAMAVWPLALAGVILAVFRQGGRALGGETAGNFALLVGAMALLATQKFDAGSLDHHNLQLIMIMLALAALVNPSASGKNATIAGVACAVSLAIGLEGILFVAVLAAYVTIMWVVSGPKARAQALGFALGFALSMAGLYLLLRPDFSATVFRCDAFGPDLLWVGLAGALGLAGLVAAGRGLTFANRALAVAGLAAGVLVVAYTVAPYCLANPLDQLSPDVAEFWLAGIDEARSLLSFVQKNNGQNAGLLLSPLLVIGVTIWLAQDRRIKAQALLMLAMVAIAYGMTLYQVRGANFLMLSAAMPLGAGLARIYHRYRAGSQKAGFLVLVLFFLATPDIPTIIAREAYFMPKAAESAAAAQAATKKKPCRTAEIFARFRTAPPGMVLASTDMGAYLLAYTPHRVLASNFHRNNAGIQAGIDIANAAPAEVQALLAAGGIDYVAYCAGDGSLKALATKFPNGVWAALDRGEVPDYLEPRFQDDLVVYEVIKAKDS